MKNLMIFIFLLLSLSIKAQKIYEFSVTRLSERQFSASWVDLPSFKGTTEYHYKIVSDTTGSQGREFITNSSRFEFTLQGTWTIVSADVMNVEGGRIQYFFSKNFLVTLNSPYPYKPIKSTLKSSK